MLNRCSLRCLTGVPGERWCAGLTGAAAVPGMAPTPCQRLGLGGQRALPLASPSVPLPIPYPGPGMLFPGSSPSERRGGGNDEPQGMKTHGNGDCRKKICLWCLQSAMCPSLFRLTMTLQTCASLHVNNVGPGEVSRLRPSRLCREQIRASDGLCLGLAEVFSSPRKCLRKGRIPEREERSGQKPWR